MDEACELIGRQQELAILLRLIDPSRPGGVLLLSGSAGVGKTALLRVMTARAEAAGLQVLSVTAVRSERDVAFAGLHALLDTQLAAVGALPPRHGEPSPSASPESAT